MSMKELINWVEGIKPTLSVATILWDGLLNYQHAVIGRP